MVVSIDVPAGSSIVLVTRSDGTMTVSIPQDAFEDAIDQHNLTLLSISSPKLTACLSLSDAEQLS